MVLCLLMINLVYIKKIYALPKGVKRVEIGNWTKTREVEDIGGEEKKLNSEVFSDIKNINMGDEASSIELLYNLYDSQKMLRTPKILISQNQDKYSVPIIGNKVLRTILSTSQRNYGFEYKTIKSWVGSDTNALWRDGNLGSKIITWPCYVEVINNFSNSETPIEWRMLEGQFNLSDDEINLIESKKVQPVIGIESNDIEEFELICPFNDVLSIFINEESTHINFKSVNENCVYRIKNTKKANIIAQYRYTNLDGNEIYCDKEKHDILSEHTYNKHLDTNILENSTSGKYYKMVGDISQYINSERNDYTISLLIGLMGRMGENASDYGGGISKLSLYLIPNPEFNVKIKPYKIKDDEKIYLDDNYKFSYNEEISFDVEIENTSTYYDFNDLDLNITLISSNKNNNPVFKVNKNLVEYKNENIKDSTHIYLNDEKSTKNLDDLSHLQKGDKLIISSEKLKYTVTEYNATTQRLDYNYIFQFKYLNDYTYYKYDNKNRIGIKPIGGKLNVTVNSNKDDYFYLKLTSKDNYANIKVKNNKTYTISNLDYDKEYKLLLMNSSSYKPQSSETFTLKNSSGYDTKSITINANQKTNNYFTQRNIDEIIINR